MTAVPLKCDECGKHKPLYIVLIKYKTEEDSDDYRDGMVEIETGYDDGRYCRQCINKLFKQEVNKS